MQGQASFKPEFSVTVKVEQADRSAVIEVCGELDSGTFEELLETVRDAVTGGARELTLDLRPMTFIDSAGTRSLIVIERLAQQHGVSLTVMQPREEVTELLRTAGLIDRVEVAPEGQLATIEHGSFVERTELELPREPHSPARARVEVRECLAGQDQSELANVVLLTSELVTNAVVHPRGVGNASVALRITRYDDRVRIEVEDTGEGFDHVASPLRDGERGRGLFLVDRFSDRWGRERVDTDAGSRFRVWFEISWGQQEANAAVG